MEAYCFKCKEKREFLNPEAGFNSRGGAVTTGTCSVCGTKMYRLGNTPAHEGLEKPVITKASPKSKKSKAAKGTKTKKTQSKAVKSKTKVSKSSRNKEIPGNC